MAKATKTTATTTPATSTAAEEVLVITTTPPAKQVRVRPQPTKGQRPDYRTQNHFRLLMFISFLRDDPAGNSKTFNEALDVLAKEILQEKSVMEHIERSGHFEMVDDKLQLTRQGRGLVMHMATAMQNDRWRVQPADYLFGTTDPKSVNRPVGKIVNIWQEINTAFANYVCNKDTIFENGELLQLRAATNVVSSAVADVDDITPANSVDAVE